MALIWSKDHIIRRGVTLSGVPSRLRRVLLKQAWFRQACFREPCVVPDIVRSCNGLPVVKRSWPIVSRDVRPPPSLMSVYDRLGHEALERGVSLARGVKVVPYRERLARCRCHVSPPSPRGWVGFRSQWCWRWSAPVWKEWCRLDLPTVPLPNARWVDDHDHLSVKWSAFVQPRFPPPPSLLQGVTVSGFVLWPNGFV